MSRIVSGPLCTRLFADLGADVVKIEPPEGDSTRRVGPFVDGESVYYAQMNAGKRNVGINLKGPGGLEVLTRLARTADVLVENFRPGVLRRYGLDAATLLGANPKQVYCSITGWGQDGPWAGRRGAAPIIHAETGSVAQAARYRQRAPEQEVRQHADVYTAMVATSAILAPLLERVATGRGQHLDIAMAEVAVYVDDWAAVSLHPPVDELGGFDTWNHFFYRLADGSYVTILGDPVVAFAEWARALGAGVELLDDPRFATAEARAEHRADLIAAIDGLTSRFSSIESLEAALGPRQMVAQVRSLAELAATDWAVQRGLLMEVVPGHVVPAAPWKSSTSTIGAFPVLRRPGEDNEAVLREVGYVADEIAALNDAGTLHRGAPAALARGREDHVRSSR